MQDRQRRVVFLLLAGVCAISGSLWLLPELGFSAAMELGLLGASCAVPAAIGGTGLLLTRHRSSAGGADLRSWGLIAYGIGAIGAPSVLLLLSRQRFAGAAGVAAETAVPVFVAIAGSALAEEAVPLQVQLLPALLGLGGALLMLPVGLPGSANGWYGFALSVLAAGLCGLSSAGLHRQMRERTLLPAVFAVAGANAVFLLLSALLLGLAQPAVEITSTRPVWVLIALPVASACSVSGVMLLLALAQPLTTASRFLLVPLLTTVEGYLLLRPTLSLRMLCGALLMLAGAVLCLRDAPAARGDGEMSLR